MIELLRRLTTQGKFLSLKWHDNLLGVMYSTGSFLSCRPTCIVSVPFPSGDIIMMYLTNW